MKCFYGVVNPFQSNQNVRMHMLHILVQVHVHRAFTKGDQFACNANLHSDDCATRAISDSVCIAFATPCSVHMLRLLSGLIPQAGRAAAVQVVTSELRATTAGNALCFRHYASQPAPSPAETVSKVPSCFAWSNRCKC